MPDTRTYREVWADAALFVPADNRRAYLRAIEFTTFERHRASNPPYQRMRARLASAARGDQASAAPA